MMLYLSKTCSAVEYLDHFLIEDYKIDPKTKAAIIITFKEKQIIIPLDNIICIEG